MTFWLGTHLPSWLARTAVPLFVSRSRLAGRKALPRALGPWALDSGGFTELQRFGRWTVSARDYAAEVRRFRDEIGALAWAAPQDWMCEPLVINGGSAGAGGRRVVFAGTGLSVAEHQRRTVTNYLELRSIDDTLPFVPVLQGWTPADHVGHAGMYGSAGVDLGALPLVGVGSVCRRQATREAYDIFAGLNPLGLRLHGFGLKKGFLKLAEGHGLESCDSMAWSERARRAPGKLCGGDHPAGGRKCANCLPYALAWRGEVCRIGGRPRQGLLL